MHSHNISKPYTVTYHSALQCQALTVPYHTVSVSNSVSDTLTQFFDPFHIDGCVHDHPLFPGPDPLVTRAATPRPLY